MNRLISVLLFSAIAAPSLVAKPIRSGTVAVELRSLHGTAPTQAGELFGAALGQLVRTYPSSAVGRIPEAALAGLTRAAAARQLAAVVHADWDKIHLPNASFDTRTPPTPLGEAISSYPAGDGLFVIQFGSGTDEPGNVTLSGSSPVLVRDLDLSITTGTGQTYTGNQMNSSEYSILQTAPYTYDRRNNVEMIVIPPYALSSFTINVSSASWGFGSSNQPFAIFGSNAY